MNILSKAFIGIFLIIALSNCSNSKDDENNNGTVNNNAQTRTLIDSPVNGITYQCDGNTDITSDGGKFECINAPVTFSLGHLEIGEVSEFNSDNFVFLQDIFKVERDNVSQEKVIKLARLLLSLDDDGDVSEAINISTDLANKFTSNESLEDTIEELISKAGVDLVSTPYALAHLKRSLRGGENSTDYSIRIKINDNDPNSQLIADDVTLNIKGAELYSNSQPHANRLLLNDPFKSVVLLLKNPPEDEQDVKILASAKGYLDTGASILLSENQKEYQLTLNMVKETEGSTSAGIFSSKLSLEDDVNINGEVLTAINLISKETTNDPGVTVKIPSGVLMTDAQGNPVQGTELKVTSFDPYESAALAAYPGGLNVIADVEGFMMEGNAQTGEREINFKSAGFVAINIEDSNGNKVKNFSQDIEIAMQFQIGTKDGEGNVVQIGDEIPIWSYDEETGKWSYEKVGYVEDLDLADNLYDVVYSTNHLTYYNLDWHFGAKCKTPKFIFHEPDGTPITSFEDIVFNLIIHSSPDIDLKSKPWGNDNFLEFLNAPAGIPGTLNAYSLLNNTLLGSLDFTNACEAPNGDNFILQLDVSTSDDYALAKAKLEQLRNETNKINIISSARASIKNIISLASHYLALGDDRGEELFDESMDVLFTYLEAFLDNIDTVFESRRTTLGFIDTSGYGCLKNDLFDYLYQVNSIYAEYTAFGGPKTYSITDLLLQFYTEATKDYITFQPVNLAYTPKGVSEFVHCGYSLYASLQAYGYDGSIEADYLDSEILDHFQPVILSNVAKMKQDVIDELAGIGVIIGDLPPPPADTISFSTAATFEFIINDALSVATDLQAAGIFSNSSMDELNAAKDYLQSLRDDGKVRDEILVAS